MCPNIYGEKQFCEQLTTLNNLASLQVVRGDAIFVVPPKVFSYVFVRTRSSVDGKLSQRVKKCVFIGYTLHTKGYKCYYLMDRKTYIFKDVTFCESHSILGPLQLGVL